MDKLKTQILKSFTGYLRKLQRGYPMDKEVYRPIIEAMRMVTILENLDFSDSVKEAIITNHLLNLRY